MEARPITAAPVEIRNLTMVYRRGGPEALAGLDLTVEAGEIFGFLGPNGAGKTTTLKILVGLLRQTSGTARLFGRDASDSGPRRQIGFLPEDPNFYEHLTARETLRFFGKLFGMAPQPIRGRTGECLDWVGLDYAADIRVGGFSKGMRQRLGLAQALLNDPDLLLLDEPLSGLDPAGRAQIRDVILDQAAAGRTVLFSSHVLPDVETICSRVGIICDGRLMESGTIDEMLSGNVETVELILTGLSVRTASAIEKLSDGVRKVRGRFAVRTMDPRISQQIMKLVISEGGTVESVTPHRETLEDYFVRRTEEGKK